MDKIFANIRQVFAFLPHNISQLGYTSPLNVGNAQCSCIIEFVAIFFNCIIEFVSILYNCIIEFVAIFYNCIIEFVAILYNCIFVAISLR